VIELAIGILVALATLFLGLSLEVVLGRNYDNHVGSTPLDFDLTGYEAPPEELDLPVKRSRAKESEVDIDLFAMDDSDQT
jgi:hypothetical protein